MPVALLSSSPFFLVVSKDSPLQSVADLVLLAIGFAGVMSGPLVRSSYRAGRLYKQAVQARG